MLAKKVIATVIFVTTIFTASSQRNDTLIFHIINSGNIKGFDKRWKNPDGSYSYWYQFNDRGRGDSLRVNYREDDQGFLTWMKAGGNDYMKNSVFEEFTLGDDTARWTNNAENDRRTVNSKAYYLGLKAFAGNIFKAFKANNNKISLLPYGEARLNILQNHVIKKGNQTKKVTLVSITGFGMTPNYYWLDENFNEFATVSNWQSSILKGYEESIPELLDIQKKVEVGYFSKLSKQVTEKVGSVVIGNVSMFDAVNANLIRDVHVLIRDGVVKEISRGKRINAKVDRYIDGKGKTLIPGLWDMHVHLIGEYEGILHMAGGVTHVRDMGNDSTLLKRKQQIIRGEMIGPDIDILCGLIDGAGQFAAPTGTQIKSVEEGKEYIRKYAKQGYQQIKLYSSIKPEWVKPLAQEAHRLGLRVAGHIPAFMTAEQAVDAGYDEITHMNMLALNFFGDTVDTRSPNRFRLPAQKTASLDLNGEAMRNFIRLLKEKNTVVDPTLAVFESLFTARDGEMEEKFKPIVHRLPVTIQRYVRAGGGGLPVPEGMNDTYLKSFDAFLKITKLLYDSGITIVPGTDGFAGFDLHRELELYAKAGIPAEKVLQLATYGAAKYAGKSNQFGSIEVGRKADVVLLEGDPVQNISNIRNTRLVIKNGVIYDTKALYGGVAITGK